MNSFGKQIFAAMIWAGMLIVAAAAGAQDRKTTETQRAVTIRPVKKPEAKRVTITPVTKTKSSAKSEGDTTETRKVTLAVQGKAAKKSESTSSDSGAAAEPKPQPTRTPRATPQPTPEVTPESTPEPTPVITPEPTPEPTPVVTPVPSPEMTPEPMRTPRPTPEPSPTPRATPEPTPMPEPPEDLPPQPLRQDLAPIESLPGGGEVQELPIETGRGGAADSAAGRPAERIDLETAQPPTMTPRARPRQPAEGNLEVLLTAPPTREVRAELRKTLRDNPQSPRMPEVLLRIGRISLALGDAHEATLAYQAALEVSEDAEVVAQANQGLAKALTVAGKLEEAGAQWEKAQAGDPALAKEPAVIAERAWMEAARGDFAAAEKLWGDLNVALEAPTSEPVDRGGSRRAEIRLGQALALEVKGDNAAAFKIYRDLVDNAPGTAAALQAQRRLDDLQRPLVSSALAPRRIGEAGP